MKQLPQNKHLPVKLLVACFNNTSATYKYYWLLSIIRAIESGKTIISKRELFSGMISSAWYTVNYFHISFGKQDKLQRAIENIKGFENLTIDASKNTIINSLINTENPNTLKELNYFNNQVPHWFLSPWFPGNNKSEIYRKSQDLNNRCLYALHDEFIQINLAWINYLLENASLIKDFCYWNLVIYLQVKNPNVPDIPNKLLKAATRNSLIKQRTQFWDIVIRNLGYVSCIYTKKKLTIGDYAVEHFIPYNFVSHDLIWNLIPADKSFNSTKSDKLPPFNKYFNGFYDLQKMAIDIIRDKEPRNKFLEDYLTIFSDIGEAGREITKEKFRDRIQPLITIASNNGFEFMS